MSTLPTEISRHVPDRVGNIILQYLHSFAISDTIIVSKFFNIGGDNIVFKISNVVYEWNALLMFEQLLNKTLYDIKQLCINLNSICSHPRTRCIYKETDVLHMQFIIDNYLILLDLIEHDDILHDEYQEQWNYMDSGYDSY